MLLTRSALARTLTFAAFSLPCRFEALGLCLLLISSLMINANAEEAREKAKPRIVARYSQSGIVSSEGLENSKFINTNKLMVSPYLPTKPPQITSIKFCYMTVLPVVPIRP